MELSVIVPTYNESDLIEGTLRSLEHELTLLHRDFEIIVVDDRSPDGTARKVEGMQASRPWLRLLVRDGVRGIGAAYHAGFLSARGRLVVGIDADLSQSPAEIAALVRELDAGAELVIGSRNLRGSSVSGCSPLKRLGSRVLNAAVRLMLGVPVTDATHSFRGFKREQFLRVAPELSEPGHPSYFIEFTCRCAERGWMIREIPAAFVERRVGASKLSLRAGARSALATLLRLRREKS